MAFYDKQKSLVRLELEVAAGQYETWYSALNDDKRGVKASIAGLKKRILERRHQGKYINAVFYQNQSGRILSGQTRRFSKTESRFKLVVWLNHGGKKVSYSIIGDNTPDNLLKEHLPDFYQTACVYNNAHAGFDGSCTAKFIRGKRIF